MLSIVAQVVSYLGSGYLLRTVVKLAARPISVVDGALLTAGANGIGTLGGGILGTAGMTYVWLRRRGVNPGAAGLAGWLPIFLNNATLAVVSLLGLAVLLFLKKSSGLLVASLCFAIFILAGGAGLLLWCLAYREKLMPMAMGITGFIARLRHGRKTVRQPKRPSAACSKDGTRCCKVAGMVPSWGRCSIPASTC